MSIRVAVVDDHAMMREGLAQLVQSFEGYEVIWQAGDAASAFEKLQQEEPDLLTVDVSLPGRNGLELVKDVLAYDGSIRILVVSMHDESLYAQRVLRAGAKGYIMKDAPSDSLEEAIGKVAGGEVWVSAEMSAKILQAFSGGKPEENLEGVHRLTDREFEVFQLIGEGKSKAAISEALNISPKTIDVHKAHIREKLELEDAAAVLRYAIRWVESKS